MLMHEEARESMTTTTTVTANGAVHEQRSFHEESKEEWFHAGCTIGTSLDLGPGGGRSPPVFVRKLLHSYDPDGYFDETWVLHTCAGTRIASPLQWLDPGRSISEIDASWLCATVVTVPRTMERGTIAAADLDAWVGTNGPLPHHCVICAVAASPGSAAAAEEVRPCGFTLDAVEWMVAYEERTCAIESNRNSPQRIILGLATDVADVHVDASCVDASCGAPTAESLRIRRLAARHDLWVLCALQLVGSGVDPPRSRPQPPAQQPPPPSSSPPTQHNGAVPPPSVTDVLYVGALKIEGIAESPCQVLIHRQHHHRGAPRTEGAPPRAMLGKLPSQVVDCTVLLRETSACFPGGQRLIRCPYHSRATAEGHCDDDVSKRGSESDVLIFTCGIGTHMDSPRHFCPAGASVADIPASALAAPLVVVDISDRVFHFPPTTETTATPSSCRGGDGLATSGASLPVLLRNADEYLTVADLQRWEAVHGPIPNGAVVCCRTGWSAAFFGDAERHMNRDDRNVMHFPGFSEAAADWLLAHRPGIVGIGIDTLSLDEGRSTTFPVHTVMLGMGKYQLENLDLSLVPQAGATLITLPLPVANAGEAPCRVMATFERDAPRVAA